MKKITFLLSILVAFFIKDAVITSANEPVFINYDIMETIAADELLSNQLKYILDVLEINSSDVILTDFEYESIEFEFYTISDEPVIIGHTVLILEDSLARANIIGLFTKSVSRVPGFGNVLELHYTVTSPGDFIDQVRFRSNVQSTNLLFPTTYHSVDVDDWFRQSSPTQTRQVGNRFVVTSGTTSVRVRADNIRVHTLRNGWVNSSNPINQVHQLAC